MDQSEEPEESHPPSLPFQTGSSHQSVSTRSYPQMLQRSDSQQQFQHQTSQQRLPSYGMPPQQHSLPPLHVMPSVTIPSSVYQRRQSSQENISISNVGHTATSQIPVRHPSQENLEFHGHAQTAGYPVHHQVPMQYFPRNYPSGAPKLPLHHAAAYSHSPGYPHHVYTSTHGGIPQHPSSSYAHQLYQQPQQTIYQHPTVNQQHLQQQQWIDMSSSHPTSNTSNPVHIQYRSSQPITASYTSASFAVSRHPSERPVIKLSIALLETYKRINTVYYEERKRRREVKAAAIAATATTSSGFVDTKKEASTNLLASENVGASSSAGPSKRSSKPGSKQRAQAGGVSGVNINEWDDENYDYIITEGEIINNRYTIKGRIGKGSFGQVVRAFDMVTNVDVAIKIIKSKKPFQIQARTEIELLTLLNEKDPEDTNNIVRLLAHFVYRNHQCLVFEMLSLNLYELLKNTQFGGVSLNLIRKFAKQILKALQYLGRPDIDVIHCDLKPENILLRHPKRSGVKVIDFGSSCKSNKRMYSYIQSRFYRSPEVMLGLPYSVSIDMWSLGCILVEMHTGEPLFSGTDQFDQMQKIVKILGMMPESMLDQARDEQKFQFFEKNLTSYGVEVWCLKQKHQKDPIFPSMDPLASLSEAIGFETSRKKKDSSYEMGHTPQNYRLFVDLILRMLAYKPEERIRPDEAMIHPFITEGDPIVSSVHM